MTLAFNSQLGQRSSRLLLQQARLRSTTAGFHHLAARPIAAVPTHAVRTTFLGLTGEPPHGLQQQKRAFSLFGLTSSAAADKGPEAVHHEIPDGVHPVHPQPIRKEFMGPKRLTTADLEAIPVRLGKHREPAGLSDWVAYQVVKSLRIPVDLFFRTKYIHRVVMLETVAAVPGLVGGLLRHLRSLRRIKHDGGWIHLLLHEAENERMHLLTWMRVSQPTLFERFLVTAVQGVFFNVFFFLYMVSNKTAHRVVGYLEEQAVISYTHMIEEIDRGVLDNGPAPQMAIDYWNLCQDASIRDLCLAIRADEAAHRDTNHFFADRIMIGQEDLRKDVDEELKAKGIGSSNEEAEKVWSKANKY
ncbi:inducible alternative oxidase 2 [Actinomortierella ambigua]|uniref:Alternative oxidase n=1 Tax=Actinomortierella ambigua TaxID=1343610 RepID=A0A9P6QID4_9FUNG|nr:inducible alternative oxidase 2 [Actinomortierella ambigua]